MKTDRTARNALLIAIPALLVLLACTPKPVVLPLGPRAFTFYGSTPDQNHFDPGPPGGEGAGGGVPASGFDPPPTTLKVMTLAVDVNDHRFTGTPADLTTWKNSKLGAYQGKLDSFWKENSFANVGEDLTMRDELFPLPGAFDDYFNRPFTGARLTTSGISGYPLNLSGVSVVLHVRDLHDRNDDVTFAPSGAFANTAALVTSCQTAFDALRPDWVECMSFNFELRIQLVDAEVKEGSFIRVKSGSNLDAIGLDGPTEAPGDEATSTQASLMGKPVTFPINLTMSASVEIEVRNKDLTTRRYTVTVPPGSVASGAALAGLFPPVLNAEFNWVETNVQSDRLGLRVKAGESGNNAAIRIVGGTNLEPLGLDGPVRVDGVITFDGRETVRTDKCVPQALSLFMAKRAAEASIAINSGNQAALDGLVDAQLGGFDSFMVIFVEDHTGIPTRRAAANPSTYYDLSIPGTGGYVYTKQIHSGLMIGTGAESWTTWAHESGHVLGFWDLYEHSTDDTHFDKTFDYLRDWSLMDYHPPAPHVEGWHKNMRVWLPAPPDVDPPAPQATEVHKFTLTPLEYPFADYGGAGNGSYPAQQLVRVKLSDSHWIQIENRETGVAYSQQLPDDTVGSVPPSPSGTRGGVLVTDTVDPWKPALFRPAVTVLNPHGADIARGLKAGDTLDLNTTYPAYDGIKIRVVDTVPGPAGKPRSLRVEVERGPGDFLELAIRPWQAPDIYATPDIWIDWPGNGAEDYLAGDPPVGNGDPLHWHPDGTVLNYIKARIHNNGTIMAKDVVVRASINTPMGMGDKGQFVPLPDSAPQDIPAGDFRNFVFEWRPKSQGHTCLRAEILTHDTSLSDLDLANNDAQENIDDFSPSPGSPYPPTDFTFTINNGYEIPINVRLLPTGLVPGMDLEIEDPYPTLSPGQTVKLKARLLLDINKIPPNSKERRRELRFNLHALRSTADAWLPFGGISINVNPTVASRLEFREVGKGRVREGEVLAVRIIGRLVGPYASGQKVDAAIVASDGKSYGGMATADSSGVFSIFIQNVPPGSGTLMLYYFGPDMAQSSLGPVTVQVP